jgi:hypothetical protein
MSFKAMTWAVNHELPAMQKIVLMVMANRFNEKSNTCWPSLESIAKESGMDKRSVIRQIGKLENIGLIRVVKTRGNNGMNVANRYLLMLDVQGGLKTGEASKLGSDRESLGSDRESLGSDRESPGVVTESHPKLLDETINEPIKEPKEIEEPIGSFPPHDPKSKKTKTKTQAELLEEFGVIGDLAADFITLRKAKRAPLTATALNGIRKEADKAGISIQSAIEVCVVKGWQSFNSTWDWPGKQPLQYPQKSQGNPERLNPSLNSNNNGANYDTKNRNNETRVGVGRKLSLVEQGQLSIDRIEARERREQQEQSRVVN